MLCNFQGAIARRMRPLTFVRAPMLKFDSLGLRPFQIHL